jgi:hypothetical protein
MIRELETYSWLELAIFMLNARKINLIVQWAVSC